MGDGKIIETLERLRSCEVDLLTAKELGDLGEAIAGMYLEERGYDIVESNYRCQEGEADLVAFDASEDVLVMVEVKTRRSRSIGGSFFPEEAVDARKQRRYRRIASCYLMEHYPVHSIRFDVVGVTIASDTSAGIEHIIGAFDWDSGR